MKKLFATLALALPLAMTAAMAADPPKEATAQQNKMAACNKEATDMKGDARKDFMKACLSKEGAPAKPAAKPATQQEKMKACNKDATGKKGDERKAFMKECLSK